jgi:hypothetical protein
MLRWAITLVPFSSTKGAVQPDQLDTYLHEFTFPLESPLWRWACDRQWVGIAVARLGVDAGEYRSQRNEREQIDAVVLDNAANTTRLA